MEWWTHCRRCEDLNLPHVQRSAHVVWLEHNMVVLSHLSCGRTLTNQLAVCTPCSCRLLTLDQPGYHQHRPIFKVLNDASHRYHMPVISLFGPCPGLCLTKPRWLTTDCPAAAGQGMRELLLAYLRHLEATFLSVSFGIPQDAPIVVCNGVHSVPRQRLRR
jgi:hypothetical protein